MPDDAAPPNDETIEERLAMEGDSPDRAAPSLAVSASRISKLSVIYIAGSLAPQIVSMFLLPVFTRYLPPKQMDMFYFMLRMMGPVMVFVQLGMSASVRMQFFHVDPARRLRMLRTALLMQLGLGAVACFLFSLAGPWVVPRLLDKLPLLPAEMSLLWLFIVWCSFFSAIQQMTTETSQLLERADLCVGLNCFGYVAQLLIGLAVVVGLGWQGLGRCGSLVMGGAITTLVAVPLMWSFGAGRFDRGLVRRILWKGLAFVPHNLAGLAGPAVSAWLIKEYAPSGTLSIFGMGVAFVGIIELPLRSFNNAAYPTLATLMKLGTAEAKRQQSRLYTIMAIGVVTLTLGVAIFAPVGIQLLTAANYHAAEEIVIILALAWLFQGFFLLVSFPVFFFGGGLWMALISVTQNVVGIGLAFVLIRRFPEAAVFGAAWALVANYLVGFLVGAWAGHKLYPLPWELGRIVRAVACGAVLAAADYYWLTGQRLLWSIPLKTLLCLLLIPMLLLVRAVTMAELRRAGTLAKNKLRGVIGA